MVGRLGGDEFAILLDNCAEDRAKHIGQQLLQALNPLEIEWGGSRYTTGASIGMAMNTMDMPDEKAWLESADQACFEAKRQGRGQLLIGTHMGKSEQLSAR
jgi:diguanylate cyclase (GGDEF)-like protein